MNTELGSIVRKHPNTFDEIERRDVVFRRGLTGEERRDKAPWVMAGRSELANEELEVWRKLENQSIEPEEAVRELTLLMQSYYGKPFPV